ncbi:MAG: hypothetical protein ACP5UV_02325 [Thermoplasmata archaeon]
MNLDEFYSRWGKCGQRTSYVPKFDVSAIRHIRMDNGDLIYANVQNVISVGDSTNGIEEEKTMIEFKISIPGKMIDTAIVDVKHIKDIY